MPALESDRRRSKTAGPEDSLLRRTIRALCLDRALYAEVLADRTAMRQAVVVVAAVGLAHALGAVVRARAQGWSAESAWVFGLAAELAFWVGGAWGVYMVSRFAPGSRSTYAAVLRPFGFACAPGLLIIVASLAALSPLRAERLLLPVLALWRMAAVFVAVRAVLPETRRALAGLLVGLLAGVGSAAVVTSALNRLFPE